MGSQFEGSSPPFGYLRNECVEVTDEDGEHGVTGPIGSLLDEHPPVLCEFPHRLGVGREERWWTAEQPFVPGHRRLVIVDWDPREQVRTSMLRW